MAGFWKKSDKSSSGSSKKGEERANHKYLKREWDAAKQKWKYWYDTNITGETYKKEAENAYAGAKKAQNQINTIKTQQKKMDTNRTRAYNKSTTAAHKSKNQASDYNTSAGFDRGLGMLSIEQGNRQNSEGYKKDAKESYDSGLNLLSKASKERATANAYSSASSTFYNAAKNINTEKFSLYNMANTRIDLLQNGKEAAIARGEQATSDYYNKSLAGIIESLKNK